MLVVIVKDVSGRAAMLVLSQRIGKDRSPTASIPVSRPCPAEEVQTETLPKWLGIASESEYLGFGVSACATCDGFFYRGRDVVVGGGNTAVEEALYLSGIASLVTVIHRRDSFRAERILRERLAGRANVCVAWNCVVDEIRGVRDPHKSVTGVLVRDGLDGSTREIPCHGVFVVIGHSPATGLFRGKLDLTETGYIAVRPGTTRTSVDGVFQAGDVADDVYRQAVTTVGMGCMPALEAERGLAASEVEPMRQAAE